MPLSFTANPHYYQPREALTAVICGKRTLLAVIYGKFIHLSFMANPHCCQLGSSIRFYTISLLQSVKESSLSLVFYGKFTLLPFMANPYCYKRKKSPPLVWQTHTAVILWQVYTVVFLCQAHKSSTASPHCCYFMARSYCCFLMAALHVIYGKPTLLSF